MSLDSIAGKPKPRSFTALGMIFGAGIALLFSQLGLEVELSVGMVLGLCIGNYIDKRKS